MNKKTMIIASIIFITIFITIFQLIVPKVTLKYNLKVNHIEHSSGLKGTIFFSDTKKFDKKKSEFFIFYDTKDQQRVKINFYNTKIQNIRLDPSSSKNTELEISNLMITRGWNDPEPIYLSLDKISSKNSSQIKIIKSTKNGLHFLTTGSDPNIVLKIPYKHTPSIFNYIYEIILIILLSILLTIYLLYEFCFIRENERI